MFHDRSGCYAEGNSILGYCVGWKTLMANIDCIIFLSTDVISTSVVHTVRIRDKSGVLWCLKTGVPLNALQSYGDFCAHQEIYKLQSITTHNQIRPISFD